MRLAIIGTGYVGLVSGACFSEFGHEVTCVDINEATIAKLKAGEIPIYEPGLEELVKRNSRFGRLKFTSDIREGVKDAEAVFIAVGTPSRRGDGHADLSYVYAAAQQAAEAVTRPCVIVTKSTVPVGTAQQVASIVAKARPDLAIEVASNPEFSPNSPARLCNSTPACSSKRAIGRSSDEDAGIGWGGRIRTSEWRHQKPLPYHLATPQHRAVSGPLKRSSPLGKPAKAVFQAEAWP